MQGIDLLLLYMLQHMQRERSISGCAHILRGKKSSQAIQDAKLFGFRHWYGLFSDVSLHRFEQAADEVEQKGLVVERGGAHELTSHGMDHIHQCKKEFQLERRAFLNTDIEVDEALRFWKRFQLLAQVISYECSPANHYDPIVHDIEVQQFIKRFWHSVKDRPTFIHRFYAEVEQLFHKLEDDWLVHLLLDRLNGFQKPGYTYHQLQNMYDTPEALLRVFIAQGAGWLQGHIQHNPSSVLRRWMNNQVQKLPVTQSTYRTYEYLQRGLDIEELSRLRGLKPSTIEDHIIEIAIFDPHFDPLHYMSESVFQQIIAVKQKLGTNKLRTLKQHLSQDVSYFQIRLALVREYTYERQA